MLRSEDTTTLHKATLVVQDDRLYQPATFTSYCFQIITIPSQFDL